MSWGNYWLVDPLDGTKGFVARNDEFTVNIALIHRQVPVLGVVYLPTSDACYFAGKGLGAFKLAGGVLSRINACALTEAIKQQCCVRVVVGRRGKDKALERLLRMLESDLAPVDLSTRSSSLKFCLLAEGEMDFYPCLSPTYEWDTAAGQVVLQEAGGAVLNEDFKVLNYNAKSSLLNPHFYALAGDSERWQRLLKC